MGEIPARIPMVREWTNLQRLPEARIRLGEGALDSCAARLRRGVSNCWVDNMERTRGRAQIRSCRVLSGPGSRRRQIDVASHAVEICTTGFVEHHARQLAAAGCQRANPCHHS